jgi:hypothetical protein
MWSIELGFRQYGHCAQWIAFAAEEQQCRSFRATGKYCKPPSACAYNSCDCWRWSSRDILIEHGNTNSQP